MTKGAKMKHEASIPGTILNKPYTKEILDYSKLPREDSNGNYWFGDHVRHPAIFPFKTLPHKGANIIHHGTFWVYLGHGEIIEDAKGFHKLFPDSLEALRALQLHRTHVGRQYECTEKSL